MKTSSLIVGATIRLSLLAGAALASPSDAKSLYVVADAQLTIGQTAQPEPIMASIVQLLAQ